MMKQKLNLIVFLIVITFCSCEKKAKEKTLSDYKFAEKGIVLNCDGFDAKLLNEALFSFEEDIIAHYGKDNPNVTRAYSQFVSYATRNRVKYSEVVSPHTVEIFEVLKTKSELWNPNSAKSKLNYDSPVFKCIVDNISDNNLKTTLNALLTTNSMSPKLFGPALQSKYSLAIRDKYLSAYMAFDLFYAKLFDVDLNQVKEKPKAKVDFNKLPPKAPETNDPHAGHNH
ncbi:hypothetical protein H7U19_04180 [Hyunsoonleella sp. SJ7]|uniref:Lipoprotein n=1 Tax=Hyunsoonleella aquatilis TaxID=2762758 RepID=A0A923H9N1_9FLAO|nr:hypothetical protein [Hyunsoonleella aquatilis]MBC3757587.1 hypothetical protein [Hyunsoonleella aquatilis]